MDRCLIISEIGINHNGNLELAKRMIKLSKMYGADIAKFQLYNPLTLLKRDDFSIDDWSAILKSKLSFEDTAMLKKTCDKENIEFMASAFDFERLEWLEKLNVKRHKIASLSLYEKEYVDKVIKTGKEVIVSFGYRNDKIESLGDTLIRLGWDDGVDIKGLYCISDYPTDLKKLNFTRGMFCMNYLKGFSDHTIGITASILAMSYGAKIIEKHFTLDPTLPGPDQKGSMTPPELLQLSKFRDDLLEVNI